MSLEAKIEALTEVMTRVAANQEEILKMARKGSDKQEASEEETPRSRRRASEDEKPADKEEAAPRRRRAAAEDDKPADKEEAPRSRRRAAEDDKPAEEDKPRRRRSAEKEEKEAPKWKRPAEGKAKLDDIRACFAEFLNTKDKAEEKDRRGHIEDILDFLNVEKTADIDTRDFDDVLDWIEQFLDGKFKGFPKD